MKKLVQFNELVFNHTAFVEEQPEIATEFKSSKSAFANSHGDYSPVRCGPRKVASKQFDVNFFVDPKKFNCKDSQVIDQFVKDNLEKVGRLWAVQGNLLLWALAEPQGITEGWDEKRGYLSFNTTFYLPEGIWHIADPTATHLEDYQTCEVLDCYETLERPLCDCCLCNTALAPVKLCPPCPVPRLCDFPDISKVIGECGNTKKITYSCEGQTETGLAYSDYGYNTAYLEFDAGTLYETYDVVLQICGTFTNLTIDWNGEGSVIEGTYTGETTINSGIVINNCECLDIDKFHSICLNNTSCVGRDCGSNSPKIGVTGSTGNIVNFTAKKGTNKVILTGFKKEEIQTIKVFVGGIAT